MLFGLAQSLRSLTRSPIATALDQAHQMARRHLETGGPVVSPRSYADHHAVPADFVLPPDIDADEVVKAVEVKLREQGGGRLTDEPPVVKRKSIGRAAVSCHCLLRLGDGSYDRGRRFVQTLVAQMRSRRARKRQQK